MSDTIGINPPTNNIKINNINKRLLSIVYKLSIGASHRLAIIEQNKNKEKGNCINE